ncbi:hypothetical protein AeRB84_004667 [Aphanomyces euteiches]|nr:hypothetical protein AeRB84_004667 [Aphanomyces euteiches]
MYTLMEVTSTLLTRKYFELFNGYFRKMVEVSLNCLVVGEKTCFPVDIDDEKKAGHLKQLIKVKKQHSITCVAHRLELYLARNGLSRDEAKAMTLDKDGKIPGCIKMDELLLIQNKDHFGMNFQPEEGKIYVLVVVPVGPASTLSSALVGNFDKQWYLRSMFLPCQVFAWVVLFW